MPARRLLLVVLLAGLAVAPLQARLGETLSDLKKRYGKPQPESRDRNIFWLFEGDNGQLLYSVTLNAEGRSIAEGMKPHKRARFPDSTARSFIDSQLLPWADSKTLRNIKPGEKYRFANQEFVCDALEFIMVDDANGVLAVWNRSVNPAVMVLSPAMFLQGVK